MNKAIAVIALTGLCSAMPAQATLIDFDTDPSGDPIPPLTLIGDLYLSLGVRFTGNFYTVADNAVSGPNSVFFHDPVSTLNTPHAVTVDFFVPGTATPGVTDFVAFTPTDSSQYTRFELLAYDVLGNLIAQSSTVVEPTARYLPLEDPQVSVAAAGIARVVMTGTLLTAGNFVIEGDDFVFNPPTPAPAGVPEPSGVALLTAGLGLVSGLRRHRREAS